LEKIFEPFYRSEATLQRTTSDAGLGLAIVKLCIEVCHGTVTRNFRRTVGPEDRHPVSAKKT
jgi:two-component system, OmpR family, sensor histidine kinase CpxA